MIDDADKDGILLILLIKQCLNLKILKIKILIILWYFLFNI